MRARKYPLPVLAVQHAGTVVVESEQYLVIEEAAAFLRTTKAGIYSLVHRGRIPAYKPSKKLLFKKSDLVRHVEFSKRG
jgi:excisionase family DNA binding protein